MAGRNSTNSGLNEKVLSPEEELKKVKEELEAANKRAADAIAEAEEARAEAEEAKAEAKKSAEEAEKNIDNPKNAENDPNLELVRVKFPKMRGSSDQDIVIMVNGKAWQIKRGVSVEVPRYVLKAYDNNEKNRDEADSYIMEQTNIAAESEK